MPTDWIDVSVPIFSGMVHWPDNPPVRVERLLSQERGDTANVSSLSMGVHTGTHMDAPVHFVAAGAGIDTVPFAAVIGPARVVEIADPVAIQPDELRPHHIERGERVLFKTRNSAGAWQTDTFDQGFVFCSHEAAAYLVEIGIQTIGVDYLSVGGYTHDGPQTHHVLLGAGVWIIEGLNLAHVAPGRYDLICLPLRIQGADGAPARALLRPLA
jgi:arylformamidase